MGVNEECLEYYGDCDNDSECGSELGTGLLCGSGSGFEDNCYTASPKNFPSTHDCCYDPDDCKQG